MSIGIKDVQTYNDLDVSKIQFPEMLQKAKRFFSIGRIAIYPKIKVSKKAFNEGVKKGKKFEVIDLSDSVFFDVYKLYHESNRFLEKYREALNLFKNSKIVPFEAKLTLIKKHVFDFERLSVRHNSSSFFSLEIPGFDLIIDGKPQSIRSEYLELDQGIMSRIRELYLVRKEFFAELKSSALQAQYELELNQSENSEFKFLTNDGEYIIAEFILGLVLTNKVNLDSLKIEQLAVRLREVFGISLIKKRFPYYQGKILDREEPALNLERMVQAIESEKRSRSEKIKIKRPLK